MAEINLLPHEERSHARAQGLRKRLQIISIVSLVVTAILTLVTLALFSFFAVRRGRLIAEIQSNSVLIDQQNAKEELIVVIGDKIAIAQKLISSNTKYPEFFDKLARLVPQGVYFTDIRIQDGKFVITGKGRTSADVAGLANSLLSAEGVKIISSVVVDSLSRDEDGVYDFVVSAQVVGADNAPKAVPTSGATNVKDQIQKDEGAR